LCRGPPTCGPAHAPRPDDLMGRELTPLRELPDHRRSARFVRKLARRSGASWPSTRGPAAAGSRGGLPGCSNRSGNVVVHAPPSAGGTYRFGSPWPPPSAPARGDGTRAKACALGSCGRRARHAGPGAIVFVSVSDGVGGVWSWGRGPARTPQRGREFGQMQVSVDGPALPCGSTGCWEPLRLERWPPCRYVGRPISPPPAAARRVARSDRGHPGRAGPSRDGAALSALLATAPTWAGVAAIVNAFDPRASTLAARSPPPGTDRSHGAALRRFVARRPRGPRLPGREHPSGLGAAPANRGCSVGGPAMARGRPRASVSASRDFSPLLRSGPGGGDLAAHVVRAGSNAVHDGGQPQALR